jgi:hypothetical protein
MRPGAGELAAAVEGRPGWSVRDDGSAVYERPGVDWEGLVVPVQTGLYLRWHTAIVEAGIARATHLAWDAGEARDWIEVHR